MPKVTNPLFSGDVRGKFGDKLIFTRGGVVRNYFKPRNPNTPAQQAVRQAFKEFTMPGLTQEQADLLYSAINHLHDDRYSLLGHGHPEIEAGTPAYRFRAAGYYGSVFGWQRGGSVTTTAIAAGGARYLPVSFPADTDIQDVTVEVTTARANAEGEIAIYSNEHISGTDSPHERLTTPVTFDLTSNGYKTAALEYTFLGGGAYWVGFVNKETGGTVTIRAIGSGSAVVFAWAASGTPYTQYIESLNGNGLPVEAGTLSLLAGNVPMIFFN